MSIKILFVGSKYDYANPSLGLSNGYYFYYDTLRYMKNIDIKIFNWVLLVRRFGRERMNELLYEQVLKFKPQLVFFLTFRDEFKKEIVQRITAEGRAITFNIFDNDSWRFDDYSKYWAPCFTWIATDERSAISKYHEIGCKNVILHQWAVNPRLYKKLYLHKRFDVSFVGQAHGNRKGIVRGIKNTGILIEAFGRGFRNGKVLQREMIRIFNQSKINLNISSDVKKFEFFRFLPAFLQPKSIGIDHFQLKARIFEITGSGGFLLTTYGEPLKEYFVLGKEIETYRNFDELVEKIKFYLKNDKAREGIAQAGYERTRREYTYEQRFAKIFKIIGLL